MSKYMLFNLILIKFSKSLIVCVGGLGKIIFINSLSPPPKKKKKKKKQSFGPPPPSLAVL